MAIIVLDNISFSPQNENIRDYIWRDQHIRPKKDNEDKG